MESTWQENSEGIGVNNRSTKKVRIKGTEGDKDVVIEAVLTSVKPRSWKECLVGTGLWVKGKVATMDNFDDGEDFELLDVDVMRSSVNGIPSINFSKRVNQILIKDMEYTVVIKLLGRNIGYSTLQNKIYSLWRLS
ncbi:hypothetical protein J1N35_040069 [Gossypium stocksii]|uniref:Uncharacterized protein n=1 Tax=Gossypium stocksii TaxID=47602 RepID=A0A9D3UD54_9ROSI|nr:hypothetical protein J1N35_040069 [Gossypium stocksii]